MKADSGHQVGSTPTVSTMPVRGGTTGPGGQVRLEGAPVTSLTTELGPTRAMDPEGWYTLAWLTRQHLWGWTEGGL